MALPLYLTSEIVGAPILNTVEGQFCTVLDWILVTQGGWTILHTGTNKRVYKMPGGSQRCLYVDHSLSSLMASRNFPEIRGCQDATDASYSGLIEPFPTQRQKAGIYSTTSQTTGILISETNNSVQRKFYAAWVTDKWIRMFVNAYDNYYDYWTNINTPMSTFFFGDLVPRYKWDNYCTWFSANGYTGNGGTPTYYRELFGSHTEIETRYHGYWIRDIMGKNRSVRGAYSSYNYLTGGLPVGSCGRLDFCRMGVSDSGLSMSDDAINVSRRENGIYTRGWLENHNRVLHSSKVYGHVGKTFPAPDYAGGAAVLRLVSSYYDASTTYSLLMEETDTWSL